MPRRLLQYVAVVLAAAAPVTGAAQSANVHQHKHFERAQIESLEKQWQQALLADDTAAMDKLLSDDYLGIEANGEVVTKAQQLEHMRSKQLLIAKLQTSDIKIKLVGQIAIVTSLAQITGIIGGEHLQGAFRYTRIYQRLAGGTWKVTNFEVTPSTRMHAGSAQASAH
jgi:ketosteroid isomerase-like protein